MKDVTQPSLRLRRAKGKEEEKKQIKIIAEDKDFVVVEKPTGMLTHPTMAEETGSLVELVVQKYPEIKNVEDPTSLVPNELRRTSRPGIVHRLDKDASGLLVIARTPAMFEHLKKQFQDKIVEKEYLVLVHGLVQAENGTIDFDIDRGREGRMAARPRMKEITLKNVKDIQSGKSALTEFWVEKRFARHTLLRVRIHTGRTHQIRVHMFAYNHPVVGDNIYFNRNVIKPKDRELKRLFLHAAHLCFFNLDNKKMCFESKLPEELEYFLEKLK